MNELEVAIAEWHRVREEIAPEDEERLWKKLRLEWNYNSNHIEGNTLTYDETVLLLIHGHTAGSHPIRDYEEMKAHDLSIELVRSLAVADPPLTEADIRELNRKLLKEPFWKSAETPDGGVTRKWIEPGKYKTQPNHVRTRTGELHRFAEPEETPARMEKWVRRLRSDLGRTDYPLPEFLAESHWSFVNIHPFDDGNGRTARLITNYILLRKDLLPMVIRSEDRDRYLSTLRRADVGNGQPLAEFMLAQILWSLDLGIRAARGEPIGDPDDLDKEISLFVREKRSDTPTRSDIETLDAIYELYVRPTIEQLDTRMESLAPLFRVFRGTSFVTVGSHTESSSGLLEPRNWERLKQERLVEPGFAFGDPVVTLRRTYGFTDYCGASREGFSFEVNVSWLLGTDSRRFRADVAGQLIPKASGSIPYSRLRANRPGVEAGVEIICRAVMEQINRQSRQEPE